MDAKKLIAVSWWTFAYILSAWAVFAFSALGDCLKGAQGAACREQSERLTTTLLIVEVLAYVLLTWLIFFRRR